MSDQTSMGTETQAEVNPLIEQQQRRAAEIGAQPGGDATHSPVIDWGEGGPSAEDPDAAAEAAAMVGDSEGDSEGEPVTPTTADSEPYSESCGAQIPVEDTGEAVYCTMPAGHDGDHYNHTVDAAWTDDDDALAPAAEPEPDSEGDSEIQATIVTAEGEAPLHSPEGRALLKNIVEQKTERALFDANDYDSPELRLRTRNDSQVSLIRVAFAGGQDLQRLDADHVKFVREADVGQEVVFTVRGHVAGVSEVEKGSEGQIQTVVKVQVTRVTSGL